MRLVLIAAVAAGLAGCEHMYGGGDIQISDAEAVQMARAEAAARRRIDLTGREPSVGRFDTGISIFFEIPECRNGGCIDGLPATFFIPAGKRRVTYADDGRV